MFESISSNSNNFKYFSFSSNFFLYSTYFLGFNNSFNFSIFLKTSALSFTIKFDNILILNIFSSNGKTSFLISYSFSNKFLLFNVSSICFIFLVNFLFSFVICSTKLSLSCIFSNSFSTFSFMFSICSFILDSNFISIKIENSFNNSINSLAFSFP